MRLKERAARLALVLLGALVPWLFVELGVRLFYDSLPSSIQSQVSNVRLWGIGGPRLGPKWTSICVGDEHLGGRNLPDLDAVRVQFGPAIYHVSTSSLGFPNVGFRTTESATRWDGVVIGDSFGFCHHVEIEDCWVPRLARETGISIANLSVPGTGSVSHGRYLEEYGRALNPRLVIWQYWVNDPRDDFEHIVHGKLPCPRPGPGTGDREPQQSSGAKRFLLDSSIGASLLRGAWKGVTGPSDQTERSDVWVFKTTRGRPLFAWQDEGASPESKEGAAGLALTLEAIGEAARETTERGAAFRLLIAPSNLQVYAQDLPGEELRAEMRAENRTSDRLVAFANEQAIDVLDLRPAFVTAAEGGADLYPDYDVHWTPDGNRLAASLVTEWVRDAFARPRRTPHPAP